MIGNHNSVDVLQQISTDTMLAQLVQHAIWMRNEQGSADKFAVMQQLLEDFQTAPEDTTPYQDKRIIYKQTHTKVHEAHAQIQSLKNVQGFCTQPLALK